MLRYNEAAMATHVPPVLPAVQAHLNALSTDTPSPDLDVKLVETLTAQVTEANSAPLLQALITPLTTALQHLQTDPTPLTTLFQRLLLPVQFDQLISLTTPEQLLTTLASPAPPIQLLGLSLVQKAAAAPSSAGVVASWLEVCKQLLTLALAAEDTGVASAAGDVILALLATDSIAAGGAGLLWRRLFGAEGVYRLFFTLTAEGTAQGRLLGILPRLLALDWELLCRSRIPAVEPVRVEEGEYGGLLLYAATAMVPHDDIIAQMLLHDFYAELIPANPRALDFLQSAGIVEKATALLENADENPFLLPHAANFLATLMKHHPDTLPTLGPQLLPSIRRDPVAAESLTLLPAMGAWIEGRQVVDLLPLSPPADQPIKTLCALFTHESLYREYLASHPDLWEIISSYASTAALGVVAIAALDLVETVALQGEWGIREVKEAPGVLLMLAEEPKRFLGGDLAGYRVLRRRWEVAGSVAELVGGRWAERLRERVRGGPLPGARWEGGEVATMEM